jgi:hypothetical protein
MPFSEAMPDSSCVLDVRATRGRYSGITTTGVLIRLLQSILVTREAARLHPKAPRRTFDWVALTHKGTFAYERGNPCAPISPLYLLQASDALLSGVALQALDSMLSGVALQAKRAIVPD